MPDFQTRQLIAHSADEMFALVADVERYPEFVPLCTSLEVMSREETPHGHMLVARMGIGHQALTDSFTTRVELNKAKGEIVARYIDGPFRHLDNHWRFLPKTPATCEVDFFISYAFQSALLGVVLGPMFDKAFRHFMTAFKDRADVIYGPETKVGDTLAG